MKLIFKCWLLKNKFYFLKRKQLEIYRYNIYFFKLKKIIKYLINYNILFLCFLKKNIIYIYGQFGILKFSFSIFMTKRKQLIFNLWVLYLIFDMIYVNLNSGWIGILFLNGLGFKSTRKDLNQKYKYWRFNIGHSQVFFYYPPKNIVYKVKNRFLLIFGLKKKQVMDITRLLKMFRIPDVYQGVGIKYPNEIIKLKKGKVRQ